MRGGHARVLRHACTAVAVVVAAGLAASSSAAAQEAVASGPGPVRFEAAAGVTLSVEGVGRYVDVVELRPRAGTLVLINELAMESYVEGVAEMPVAWHVEALKAQAVAARTYAWFQMTLGTFNERGLGYDICDSTACQVFRGREWVEASHGERWRDAVAATAGEVLVYEGAPILARYFSTSGGHTRNNEHVFPEEGPRPYLVGVPDPDDAIAPLHRWQVRFPRADFEAILSQGEQLRAAIPVGGFEFVVADGVRGDRIRVLRTDGHAVEVAATDFRRFFAAVAPQLFPDRYPSSRPDGGRLPETLPSSRLDFTVSQEEIVVDGYGWGHGVGLGQWGARGKAERGFTHAQILASYYNGLFPTTTPAAPQRVRVGIDDAVSAVTVTADGPFRVTVGGVTVAENGLGTWRTRAVAGGAEVVAPQGFGAPLEVAATHVSRGAPTVVERVSAATTVNKTVDLSLVVTDAVGAEVTRTRVGVVDEGTHTVTWDLDGADGTPLAPGAYAVALLAVDETGASAGQPAAVEVRAVGTSDASLELSARPPRGSSPEASVTATYALAGAAGAVTGALVAGGATRRRGDARARLKP